MTLNLQDKKILVVDDDPDIVRAIEAFLAEHGPEIHVARDGDAAVTKAQEVHPDLIILDAMLPKRSGLLVLEKIKPKKNVGGTPLVLMITANEGKRQEQFARSQGVDGYLNKPFSMEKLLAALEKLVPAS